MPEAGWTSSQYVMRACDDYTRRLPALLASSAGQSITVIAISFSFVSEKIRSVFSIISGDFDYLVVRQLRLGIISRPFADDFDHLLNRADGIRIVFSFVGENLDGSFFCSKIWIIFSFVRDSDQFF